MRLGLLSFCSVIVALLSRGTVHADIFKYGSSPDDLSGPSQHHWDYSFAGDDWVNGSDNTNGQWTCNGGFQSPIHIVSSAIKGGVDEPHRSRFKYGTLTSNGSNVEVINTGHSVQVEWLGTAYQPDTVTVALPAGSTKLTDTLQDIGSEEFMRVNITPLQFHFHTPSEHFIAGRSYVMEGHIVGRVNSSVLSGCPDKGCFTVTTVLFELSQDDSADAGEHPFLKQLLNRIPLRYKEISYLPAGATLDFNQLLPANRSYVTYNGSLTSPPCTEGVLWHVLLNAQKMSLNQLAAVQMATGDEDCVLYNGSVPAQTVPAAANATGGNSRRLQQATGQEPLDAVWDTGAVSGMHYKCKRLGAGFNARRVQPRNGRQLRAFIDMAAAGSDYSGGLDYYIPRDPHDAMAAGAVAGIVLGVLFGSGLTAGALVLAYKVWSNKRRQKQFWGLSPENMRMMEQEYESQFEQYKVKSGAAAAFHGEDL